MPLCSALYRPSGLFGCLCVWQNPLETAAAQIILVGGMNQSNRSQSMGSYCEAPARWTLCSLQRWQASTAPSCVSESTISHLWPTDPIAKVLSGASPRASLASILQWDQPTQLHPCAVDRSGVGMWSTCRLVVGPKTVKAMLSWQTRLVGDYMQLPDPYEE